MSRCYMHNDCYLFRSRILSFSMSTKSFVFLRLRNRARRSLGVLAIAASVISAVVPASLTAQEPVPSFTVSGAVANTLTLTAADLAAMPRQSVTSTSNGMSTTYEGVWLSDILTKAGVQLGSRARGVSLSMYIMAVASDGYQVLFSLGEVDPGITDGKYLIADTANGKPMYGETGAFRIVVPSDKRGARSLRMLSAIKVVQVPKE